MSLFELSFGDEVESFQNMNISQIINKNLQEVIIYSVNPFVVSNDKLANAVKE